MTIHNVVGPCDKASLNISQGYSNNIKSGHNLASQFFSTESSICSNLTIKRGKKVKKKVDYESPYIDGEGVHLISRVTEKRFVRKKGAHIVSSFPLAANIYKANSDEFKSTKKNKKVLKSVLTLPNDSSPAPQICTVSDMNDSEYLNRDCDNRKKIKKRAPPICMTKFRTHDRDSNVYNRRSRYGSTMDMKFDYSSTDTEVEDKRKPRLIAGPNKKKTQPHDVWAVLRNMNRFPFKPSPPASEDSFASPKKIKPKRRNNRKDNNMRVVEKCCIEEFAYISAYDVDNKSSSIISKSSVSFDKITVIDNQDNNSDREIRDARHKKKDGTFLDSYKANKKYSAKNRALAVKPSVKVLPYTNNSRNPYSGDSNLHISQNNIENRKTSAIDKTEKNNDITIIIKSDKDTSNVIVDHALKASQSSEITVSANSGSSKAFQHQNNINNRRAIEIKGLYVKLRKQYIHTLYLSLLCPMVSPVAQLQHADLNKSARAPVENKFSGITKVFLSKSKNVEQPIRLESPRSKPRQIATVPNNNVIIPKLRVTEIKRRLNNIKYPVVILERDELTSTVEVTTQEPCQFDGLDKQIWPFMQKWYGIDQLNASKKSNKTKLSDGTIRKNIINKQKNDDNILTKKLNSPRKPILKSAYDPKRDSSKIEHTRVPVSLADIIKQTQEQDKLKPMRQLRDRMIKLLYKNNTLGVIDGCQRENSVIHENDYANNNMVDIGTEMINSSIGTDKDSEGKLVVPNSKGKMLSSVKYPLRESSWAKGKWASDFIDNVIRKIKAGVYYTFDNKVSNRKCSRESKEVDIQTDSCCEAKFDKSTNSNSNITTMTNNLPLVIPGFDDILPPVEITSMNMNEISVKHCVTNIMVHFDVTVPTKPTLSGTSTTSFFIQVDNIESHTKTFKYKNSILNAMLPAELCSILPQMFRKFESEQIVLPLIPIEKTSSNLSIISEVTHCETLMDVPKMLAFISPMSQELCRLLTGRYTNVDQMFTKFHILGKKSLLVKYEKRLLEDLMPQISISHFIHGAGLTKPRMLSMRESSEIPPATSNHQISTCTALNIYNPTSYLTFELLNMKSSFESLSNIINNSAILPTLYSIILSNTCSINVELQHYFQDLVTLSIGNFKMEFSFNGCSYIETTFNKNNFFINKLVESPCIEYVDAHRTPKCLEYVNISSSGHNQKKTILNYASINNTRRKGFVKLYKKSKSYSKRNGEKKTRLNNIFNLKDFYQALGFRKFLSNVFDEQAGRKIMSSIQEMKNWTTEINPRQALLVLLLANKKDTSNLLRYRTVILQGIAVNRITKANELDMEIEVIERENLNRLSQYEGITYLPASEKNRDNLFEELYWIAKTTASDYQRPFDESSEKLLKSLLEKRKKLNPSYLRVMARYVGLGLLKSSGNK